MEVYVALNSAPDYHAPAPTFHSVHLTLQGAINALYPDSNYEFRKWSTSYTWEGPDGFGMIKLVDVLP